MNRKHEAAFVHAFIRRERQARYLAGLASTKTRHKLITYRFCDTHDLDMRFARRIEPSEQFAEPIYALLRGKGAPDTCYVFGASELDGQEIDLREALAAIVGHLCCTFISCLPGKLVYFEAELENERYLLDAPAPDSP